MAAVLVCEHGVRGMTERQPGTDTLRDKVLHGDPAFSAVDTASSLRPHSTTRINAQPEHAERGLAQLVLTLVELIHQLMERQALQRVEAGDLSDAQVERLGQALQRLDSRMKEILDEFELTEEDLALNLGPLGDLM